MYLLYLGSSYNNSTNQDDYVTYIDKDTDISELQNKIFEKISKFIEFNENPTKVFIPSGILIDNSKNESTEELTKDELIERAKKQITNPEEVNKFETYTETLKWRTLVEIDDDISNNIHKLEIESSFKIYPTLTNLNSHNIGDDFIINENIMFIVKKLDEIFTYLN